MPGRFPATIDCPIICNQRWPLLAGLPAPLLALVLLIGADIAPAEPGARTRVAELAARARQDGLARKPRWLALLHYDPAWAGVGQSRVGSGRFFLSDQGRWDPEAELLSTLIAFLEPAAEGAENQHALCAYPARRIWLTERLGISDAELPAVECRELTAWRSEVEVGGLTLVFAEATMDDPASMFGHTLLRIDPPRPGAGRELLGYSIDFAASPGPDSLPVYLFKGMTGFYPGRFNLRRFYEGLKRYSEWENRDLWEYRLDLDDHEIELMLLHLWELRDAELPYYFFTKNCSYELLGLLDVADPELRLREGFPAWVIPIDTVRALRGDRSLVQGVAYRPSPETELRYALAGLSSRERAMVEAIVETRLEPESEQLEELPVAQAARILEVAYDWLRYEFLRGAISEDDSRSLSHRILRARSRLDVIPAQSPGWVESPGVPPDQGHSSARLSMAAGWRDDEWFVDLGIRPALHSLLDDSRGYSGQMELSLLDARLRVFPESGRVRLQQLTLIGLSSLNPRSRVFRPWAWSFETGLETRRVPGNGGLDDASVWQTNVAAGLSFDPTSAVVLYGLADMRLDVGSELDDDFSLGPGARIGAFLTLAPRARAQLFADMTWFALGAETTRLRAGSRVRYSTTRDTALVLEGVANRIHGVTWIEGQLRINLHF